MAGDKYLALEQFLGGYLHQDYAIDYGNATNAIKAFVAVEPDELIQTVLKELDVAIPDLASMADPETFLWKGLACYFSPRTAGVTVTDWLRWVRQVVCEEYQRREKKGSGPNGTAGGQKR